MNLHPSILIIADPIESFKLEKDTTFRLMQEAQKYSYDICFSTADQLSLENNTVYAKTKTIHLSDDALKPYQFGCEETRSLQDFKVVLMRKDPPFDLSYVAALWLLRLAEKKGARIINQPESLLLMNEKLNVLEFKTWMPPTLVTSSLDDLLAFWDEHQDIIIKPLDGMGGIGVQRIKDRSLLTPETLRTTANHRMPMMAQRYIPEISLGDRRIIIIHGKPVPHVLARIPQKGHVAANLAAGGTGIVQKITPAEQQMATELGAILHQKGVSFAGLDVIGSFVTEINITSPTCLVEIEKETKQNFTKWFFDGLS